MFACGHSDNADKVAKSQV